MTTFPLTLQSALNLQSLMDLHLSAPAYLPLIKIQNISGTPERSLVSPVNIHYCHYSDFYHHIILVCSWSLYKWNHSIYSLVSGFFWLVSWSISYLWDSSTLYGSVVHFFLLLRHYHCINISQCIYSLSHYRCLSCF